MSKLAGPLPGWSAQKALSPIGHSIHPPTPDDAVEAAVTLLLKPSETDDSFTMSYIKRGSRYGSDKHKGQISFPGGKRELSDTDLKECALRETEEELGVPREQIEVLGALSPFYVFISGFIVYPYVVMVPADTVYNIDPDEVEYVIEVSIDHLLDNGNLHYREHRFRKTIIKESPYFDLGSEEMLWGATAMMTNEFLEVLKNQPDAV